MFQKSQRCQSLLRMRAVRLLSRTWCLRRYSAMRQHSFTPSVGQKTRQSHGLSDRFAARPSSKIFPSRIWIIQAAISERCLPGLGIITWLASFIAAIRFVCFGSAVESIVAIFSCRTTGSQAFGFEFMEQWSNNRRSQPPLARSIPLSRFTSRIGGGSAFFVRWL